MDAARAAALGALRSGAALLLAAAALILAGGSAHGFWTASFFRAHGGLLGQAELWVASQAIGVTGAQILAVFLAIAGGDALEGGALAALIREGGVLLLARSAPSESAPPKRRGAGARRESLRPSPRTAS